MTTIGSVTTSGASALAILASHVRDRDIPIPRAMVAPNRRCPDEGLALLGAYVAIEDPDVRQAILDVVSILSGTAHV